MRFLIDSNLPPALAAALREAGHDAVHTREVELTHAKDEAIFEFAREQDRVIVSLDTDFSRMLATLGATSPSLILLRREVYRAERLALLILNRLPELSDDLDQGAIVTFEPGRVRILFLSEVRNNMATMKAKRYRVIFDLDPTGWWVIHVPSVKGCHTQARSIAQGRRHIRDALSLWVDDARTVELVEDIRLPKPAREAVSNVAEANKAAERAERKALIPLADLRKPVSRPATPPSF